jgi:hypothetical protein
MKEYRKSHKEKPENCKINFKIEYGTFYINFD